MFASTITHIFPDIQSEMPQKKLGDAIAPSLYTSASCMDFRQRRDEDSGWRWQPDQHLQPTSHQHQQRPGQLPHSSPLPQTQWTDVPTVYRPRNWVDPEEVSPVAFRQSYRPDPMSVWRARPAPRVQAAPPSSRQDAERRKKRRVPRIFRRHDTVEPPQQQPFDVTMLYPQMSPYDPSRMSTYSAPEQLEHVPNRSISQPNSPGFAPSWSALPSRSEEPSSIGIPRSPTYPPAGRRRVHSTTGRGDAAFDDEQDFRLFVEATAGLPHDVGFSLSRSGQSPTHALQSQSPLRRAATMQPARQSEISPTAETPTTMFALQQLASIPQANQTYQPRRATQSTSANSSSPSRPQAFRSDSNRARLAASASGLDLWLPSPVSPEAQSQPPQDQPTQSRPSPSRPGNTSLTAHAYPDVSPMTPTFLGLDREIERQLEELELEEDEEARGRERDYDDELPNYAQSQAEAQAERRAEAARRAQELQERWLRRGR